MPEASPLLMKAAPAIFLLFWSGGFAAGKIGLAYTGPLTFLAVRYALVLLVLLPLTSSCGRPCRAHRWRGDIWRWLGFSSRVSISARLSRAGDGYLLRRGGLIVSLQPILVALAAPRMSGERVGGWAWFGLDWAGWSSAGHPGAIDGRSAAGARRADRDRRAGWDDHRHPL